MSSSQEKSEELLTQNEETSSTPKLLEHPPSINSSEKEDMSALELLHIEEEEEGEGVEHIADAEGGDSTARRDFYDKETVESYKNPEEDPPSLGIVISNKTDMSIDLSQGVLSTSSPTHSRADEQTEDDLGRTSDNIKAGLSVPRNDSAFFSSPRVRTTSNLYSEVAESVKEKGETNAELYEEDGGTVVASTDRKQRTDTDSPLASPSVKNIISVLPSPPLTSMRSISVDSRSIPTLPSEKISVTRPAPPSPPPSLPTSRSSRATEGKRPSFVARAPPLSVAIPDEEEAIGSDSQLKVPTVNNDARIERNFPPPTQVSPSFSGTPRLAQRRSPSSAGDGFEEEGTVPESDDTVEEDSVMKSSGKSSSLYSQTTTSSPSQSRSQSFERARHYSKMATDEDEDQRIYKGEETGRHSTREDPRTMDISAHEGQAPYKDQSRILNEGGEAVPEENRGSRRKSSWESRRRTAENDRINRSLEAESLEEADQEQNNGDVKVPEDVHISGPPIHDGPSSLPSFDGWDIVIIFPCDLPANANGASSSLLFSSSEEEVRTDEDSEDDEIEETEFDQRRKESITKEESAQGSKEDHILSGQTPLERAKSERAQGIGKSPTGLSRRAVDNEEVGPLPSSSTTFDVTTVGTNANVRQRDPGGKSRQQRATSLSSLEAGLQETKDGEVELDELEEQERRQEFAEEARKRRRRRRKKVKEKAKLTSALSSLMQDEPMYTAETFACEMLGGYREPGKPFFQLRDRMVLMTDRCFLTDEGEPQLEYGGEVRPVESSEFAECMELMTKEYEHMVGHSGPIRKRQYQILIARAVVKRIQVTCGLTVYMYWNASKTEIICVVRAEEKDLENEAERLDYPLQLRNRPKRLAPVAPPPSSSGSPPAIKASYPLGAEGKAVTESEGLKHRTGGRHSFRSSIRGIGGLPWTPEHPHLDPGLYEFCKQPKLLNALAYWGDEDAISAVKDSQNIDPQSLSCMWRLSLPSLPAKKGVRFGPFAPFRSSLIPEGVYRRYSLHVRDSEEISLFRQVDRIRLISSIMNRNVRLLTLQEMGHIKDMFPLHDRDAIRDLKTEWAFNPRLIEQPIHKIRNYFGEKHAFYFAWLEYFTKMLLFPAFIGLIVAIGNAALDSSSSGLAGLRAFYSCVTIVWSVLFQEGWKRRTALLNLFWGNSQTSEVEKARASFVGKPRLNPVTDEMETWYRSASQRTVKMSISLMVIFVMMFIVVIAIGLMFWLNYYFVYVWELENGETIIGIIIAVQIQILSSVYKHIAVKLNDWENHRTQQEYMDNRIIKVFLFEFVNSYSSLFYIAFVKVHVEPISKCNAFANDSSAVDEYQRCINGDVMRELGVQLQSIYFASLIMDNIQELVQPIIIHYWQVFQERRQWKKEKVTGTEAGKRKLKKVAQGASANQAPPSPTRAMLTNSSSPRHRVKSDKLTNKTRGQHKRPPKLTQAEQEALLLSYEDEDFFDDYNEIVTQYGYLTLFVVAFPLAPLCAVVINTVEIHIDAAKLCTQFRRPYPDTATGIGTWLYILDRMVIASIISNSALLIFTLDILGDHVSSTTKFAVFVVVEHLLLLIKELLSMVPDEPHIIKYLRMRYEHISRRMIAGISRKVVDPIGPEAIRADMDYRTIHPNPNSKISKKFWDPSDHS